MNRPVPPAVDALGWAWVLSVVLAGVVHPPSTVPWVAVLAVALGTLAYRVLALRRPGTAVLRGAVWTVGAAAALAVLGAADPAPTTLVVLGLSGAAAAVAGLSLPPIAAAVTAGALQVWHAAWVLLPSPAAGAASALAESALVAATSCATAVLVARAIRLARGRIDGLVAGMLADRRTLRADEARDRARQAARADLHDTVLTTLSAVGAGWVRSADPAELRAEFTRTVAALAGPAPRPVGGVPLLEALRSTAAGPRFAGLQVDVTGAETVVAAPVAAALRLAAGEALTNVVKHAGVDRAAIDVRQNDRGVSVVVQDRGRGPDAGSGSGLGLADSVGGRMAAIGGRGDVRRGPDGGTEVRLLAPVDPLPTVPRLPSSWPGDGPRTAVLWLTALTSLTGIAAAGLVPSAIPTGAAGWLLLVAAAVVLVVVARTGRVTDWLALLVGAVGPAVVLLGGLPGGGCAGLAQPPLTAALGALVAGLVLALTRRRRDALLGLAATTAGYLVVAGWAADAGPACTASVSALLVMHGGQVAAAVLVVASLRSRAEEVRADLGRDASRRDHSQDAAALAGELDRLLPAIRLAVADTVTGLASGDLDPQDGEVRARCRRDARLVRSLLTSGADADPLLRQLVDLALALRPHGVDLAVRGGLPAGTTGRYEAAVGTVTAVLGWLTRSGWSGDAEVTLQATGSDAVLSLLAHDVPEAGGDPTWGTSPVPHVELVDGTLWMTVHLPLPAEVPP